jgi:hypothetical protein
VYFVTRLKKNAVYTVVETLREQGRVKGRAMVPKKEIINPNAPDKLAGCI